MSHLTWDTISPYTPITCIAIRNASFVLPDGRTLAFLQDTVFEGEYQGRDNGGIVLYTDACRDGLVFPPDYISLQSVNGNYCFRCERYHRTEEFIRHPNVTDPSPILSQVCVDCYRRVKNKVSGYNTTARRLGGKAGLRVAEWLEILKASEGRCHYCCEHVGYMKLVVEHATPLSWQGGNVKENVVPACMSCNATKARRDVPTWLRDVETQRLLTEIQERLDLDKGDVLNLAMNTLAEQVGILPLEVSA